MSTLQKNFLTSTLGKRAGTKLYQWLNPCCDQFCKDVKACVGDSTLPYKVYRALLTQTGTDAPVATVLENTIGANITYNYNSAGQYVAVSDINLFNSPNEDISVTGNYAVTAVFECKKCSSYQIDSGSIPPQGDTIFYYSCTDGSLQSIPVEQGSSYPSFCSCDDMGFPYSQNGTTINGSLQACLYPPVRTGFYSLQVLPVFYNAFSIDSFIENRLSNNVIGAGFMGGGNLTPCVLEIRKYN